MTNYENDKVMEKCPRFQDCSCPICPLDAFVKDRMAGGELCLYTFGYDVMPKEILGLVPEKNVAYLSVKNQKRHNTSKKDSKI